MNKSIQDGFVLPLKNKYPSARLMIYEIGRGMEKFYYDKDRLLIKIWTSENQKMLNDVNLKQETINMFNELTNQQFEKNEVL